MRTSEQTDKIDAAMLKVQSALRLVEKNKTLDVESRKEGGTSWKSKYATLGRLYEACHDTLTGAGVVVYQGGGVAQGGGERVYTRLAFDGQWIESDFPVKASRDGAQGFGGGASFARRWGLCYMVGLVTADDAEEESGYKDSKVARAQRQKAAPGVAAAVASINGIGAADGDTLYRIAVGARSSFPTGDDSAAVERAIATWFVHALGNAQHLDEVTELRDLCNKVKPRGSEVREAIRAAESRLAGG